MQVESTNSDTLLRAHKLFQTFRNGRYFFSLLANTEREKVYSGQKKRASQCNSKSFSGLSLGQRQRAKSIEAPPPRSETNSPPTFQYEIHSQLACLFGSSHELYMKIQ